MARNVHTKEGIEPETTGPRGQRLSPAQARVLKLLASGMFLLRCGEMIGNVPHKFRERGAWVIVTFGDMAVPLVSGETVEAMINGGLLETVCHRGQTTAAITASGCRALEAGNIG